jgi:hypothetical protein
MRPLVEAELMRLRSVRSTVPILVGVLGLAVLTALLNLSASPGQFGDDLGGASMLILLVVASAAATVVAYEFKRGGTALTYLAEPRRERVLGARMATYAAAGGAFAAVATAGCCLAGMAWADHKGLDVGLTAGDVIGRTAGGAAAGAIFAVAGVLIATAVRNPTAAGQVIVLAFIVESFLPGHDLPRYLPFGAAQGLAGAPDQLAPLPALAVLAAYLGVLYLAVRRWALGHDLT